MKLPAAKAAMAGINASIAVPRNSAMSVPRIAVIAERKLKSRAFALLNPAWRRMPKSLISWGIS